MIILTAFRKSMNWDSPISIVVGYSLDVWGSILITSKLALGPTQLLQWILGAVSLRVKQLGYETDHSPTSSAEVKNCGTIPSFPHSSSWHNA
jgi:hypothetical protein